MHNLKIFVPAVARLLLTHYSRHNKYKKKRLALIIMNVDEKLSMLSLTGKTSNFHLGVKLSSSKVTDVHIPSYTIPLGVK